MQFVLILSLLVSSQAFARVPYLAEQANAEETSGQPLAVPAPNAVAAPPAPAAVPVVATRQVPAAPPAPAQIIVTVPPPVTVTVPPAPTTVRIYHQADLNRAWLAQHGTPRQMATAGVLEIERQQVAIAAGLAERDTIPDPATIEALTERNIYLDGDKIVTGLAAVAAATGGRYGVDGGQFAQHVQQLDAARSYLQQRQQAAMGAALPPTGGTQTPPPQTGGSAQPAHVADQSAADKATIESLRQKNMVLAKKIEDPTARIDVHVDAPADDEWHPPMQ